MRINYAALNAKIAGRHKVSAGDGAIILRWLPHGPVRVLIANMVAVPGYARTVEDYIRIWKNARQLRGVNARVAQAILGAEIDLRNFIWMYRLKKYRGITGEEAFGKLVPVRWRLKNACWRRLVNAPDEVALLGALADGPYAKIFGSFVRPEHALDAAVARVCHTEAKRHPQSIAALFGFLLKVPASPYVVPASPYLVPTW
ncbi:MAG: V-type ATPase subunit [Defluviitaleaceae bacterium]|nr:V-type ATPase subunit [Defluviitaleaceae bacterium]